MAEDLKDMAVAFGDKRIETAQFDRYKGRLKVTDRVAVISSTLLRAWAYYYNSGKNKTLFRAPTDPDTLALCKEVLGEPEQRFGMVLFHYLTDENGALLDTEKCRGKVKLWRISESRYEELSNLHKEWPLLNSGFDKPQCDIVINCSEEQYQRMTFTPTKEAFWKKKEAWYNTLIEREKRAQEKLKMVMGKTYTAQEIRALLGTASGGKNETGSIANVNDLELSDILDDGPAAANTPLGE